MILTKSWQVTVILSNPPWYKKTRCFSHHSYSLSSSFALVGLGVFDLEMDEMELDTPVAGYFHGAASSHLSCRLYIYIHLPWLACFRLTIRWDHICSSRLPIELANQTNKHHWTWSKFWLTFYMNQIKIWSQGIHAVVRLRLNGPNLKFDIYQ